MRLTGDGQVGDLLQGPRQGKQQHHDHAHNGPDNRARSMPGHGIECDGPSEDVAAHQENEEDDLRRAEELPPESLHTNGLEQHLASIRHVVHMRIRQLELSQHVTRVRCDDPQTDERDKAAHNAHGCQHRRQGQDAERDGLGDHGDARLPPGEGAVLDFIVALVAEGVLFADGGFALSAVAVLFGGNICLFRIAAVEAVLPGRLLGGLVLGVLVVFFHGGVVVDR